MRSEFKLFGVITAFLFSAAAVYSWWTWTQNGRVEWIGFIALILCGLLCSMCGGYFWFVSRRIEPRPEDQPDAEIADGAGEIGFFSPGSYWPIGIAAAAALTGLGLVFFAPWLIAVGMVAVLMGTGGLLFEYYSGSRRGAEH